MAIPHFEDFISIQNSFNRAEFTTINLYKAYVFWLTNEKNMQKAPINELLFQLQIISAYVQHTLAQSNNENTDLITTCAIPDDIKKTSESRHEEINGIINLHFLELDKTAYEAATQASTQFFKLNYNACIALYSGIAALLIGAAFAPTVGAAGAITLWVLGGVSGALALLTGTVRFFADTSTPEVSFHKEKNLLGEVQKYRDIKRKAIYNAWFPLEKSNGLWKINEESPTIKTAMKLACIIGNDKATNIANVATFITAAIPRFSPMYQSATAPCIEKYNGSCIDQPVNLKILAKRHRN